MAIHTTIKRSWGGGVVDGDNYDDDDNDGNEGSGHDNNDNDG